MTKVTKQKQVKQTKTKRQIKQPSLKQLIILLLTSNLSSCNNKIMYHVLILLLQQ